MAVRRPELFGAKPKVDWVANGDLTAFCDELEAQLEEHPTADIHYGTVLDQGSMSGEVTHRAILVWWE